MQALRQVMAARDDEGKFDWSKTWVAEMFMSGEEAVKRAAEIERLQGKTPETKRRNEIKAGVITASAGVALMIALFMIMEGIILGGRVSDAAAAILSRIWIVGVIPLFVGLALIVNGMFVSKRIDIHSTEKPSQEPAFLPPAETNQLAAGIPFSITDETTQHLKTPEKSAPKK